MRAFVLLFLVVVAVQCEKPPQGSDLCNHVLQQDCSTFETEVVCGSDGVTYHNSCEFAKAQCSGHGHALHAVHAGPC
ncbi:turripeptide Gsp9.3-like [Crassostrea angulata]|uniref:turripeptide Gsp9.3-like n=1 Tax=Magallana angulata TaxID=2784310 RepID=UPI0022B1867E|nr:turripeptide Gsp9.3-like [Crassostrea angulata]